MKQSINPVVAAIAIAVVVALAIGAYMMFGKTPVGPSVPVPNHIVRPPVGGRSKSGGGN